MCRVQCWIDTIGNKPDLISVFPRLEREKQKSPLTKVGYNCCISIKLEEKQGAQLLPSNGGSSSLTPALQNLHTPLYPSSAPLYWDSFQGEFGSPDTLSNVLSIKLPLCLIQPQASVDLGGIKMSFGNS